MVLRNLQRGQWLRRGIADDTRRTRAAIDRLHHPLRPKNPQVIVAPDTKAARVQVIRGDHHQTTVFKPALQRRRHAQPAMRNRIAMARFQQLQRADANTRHVLHETHRVNAHLQRQAAIDDLLLRPPFVPRIRFLREHLHDLAQCTTAHHLAHLRVG